jgi:inosine/xanthosine triphosphatase
MKTVVVASANPVKVTVAKRAFAAVFPDEQFDFIEMKSESGVPDQPMGDEARQGAQNRIRYIQKQHPHADFWIGQEGGLCQEGDRLFARAWIAVLDQTGFMAESSTAQFYLPKKIVDDITAGMELGNATDKFFATVNSKHGLGAVGYLTDGIIDRTEYYFQAAIVALSEIKHKAWYV